MTGSGHYVRGSGRGSLPGRVVVVVTPSAAEDHSSRTSGVRPAGFRLAVVAHCQRRGSGYSSPLLTRFSDPRSFWEWLESPSLAGRRSYVFSPVASDSLTLLGLWGLMESHGVRWAGQSAPPPTQTEDRRAPDTYTIRRWCLNGSPDILDYTISGKSYRWCSARNYFRAPEGEVAAATGYQWRSVSEYDDSAGVLSADPDDRALMWTHALTELMLWWRDRQAGRFPLTLAGMGYSFLRSRLAPRALCTHTHPDIVQLERRCCHGGRATLWYVGDVRPKGRYTPPAELPYPSGGEACVPGPVHHVDIRSMYPSLMRDREYPVMYYTQYSDVPVSTLAEMLAIYHVCARVSLHTDRAEYPHRHGYRVIYPTGRFTTHLTSPELSAALAHGAITHVHHASLYHRGRPFVRAATELLEMRAAAEREGRKDWATFVKGITNSATGKLAQRKYTWIPQPHVHPMQMYGAWYDMDTRTGKVTQYKTLAGLVWERSNEEGGIGALTAAYAHLTAYGRCMMREIRERLPARSVISQDTDGLWITDAALAVVSRDSDMLTPAAGLLRKVQSVSCARFWSAQHYCAGGSWTLAGFGDATVLPGAASFSDHSTLNPVRGAPLEAPTELIGIDNVKSLGMTPCDGIHDDSGWMTPYNLPGGVPTKPYHPPPPPGLLD